MACIQSGIRRRIGWFWLAGLLAISGFSASTAAAENDKVGEAAPVISVIRFDIRRHPADKTDWTALAESLVSLRPGDRFAPARLQEGLDALRQSGQFQEIHVDSREAHDTMALLFRLTPFQRIKNIAIQGEYPLFDKDILDALTVRTGDPFQQAELPKQSALVIALFEREGFTGTKVTVAAEEDPKDGYVVLRIDIHKGPYDQLKKVKFRGNRAFSADRLRPKMSTWRASLLPGSWGRFVTADFETDLKQLTDFYRRKGFVDCRLTPKIEMSARTGRVAVELHVEEGPRYEVEFAGNQAFGNRILKKDLVLFEEGNQGNRGLRRSVRKIKERYRQAGFGGMRVTQEEQTADQKGIPVRKLRLVIEEGARTRIDAVEIAGNKALSTKRIKKQMLTRPTGFREQGVYVPAVLEEDLYAIQTLYRRRGYVDARVTDTVTFTEDRSRAAVKIDIDEGRRHMVSEVNISGLTVIGPKAALAAVSLKAGRPFREYMLKSDENTLAEIISEKGYPYVTVKAVVQSGSDPAQAAVRYDVTEGAYVEMGQTYFSGNFRTKPKILKRELEMTSGDPFSLKKMLQGQQNLRNLGVINAVGYRTIGLEEKRSRIHLLAQVEEKKPYFVELGGGFQSDSGLFAQLRGGDHNLWGRNIDAWAGGGVSEIGYRVESALTDPRLWGTRTAATISVFAEEREEFNLDFKTTTLGAGLGLSRKWFQQLSTGLNFRYERRDQTATDGGRTDEDIFDPRNVLVTTPSILYDTRDSFIRPKKGSYSALAMDISKGFLGVQDDFLQYRLDLRYFYTPLSRLTLAWVGRAGFIDPFGDTQDLPDDQLLFLGGIADVRGFDENLLRVDDDGDPVGGRRALSASLEARVDLGRHLELSVFYDGGQVADTFIGEGSGSWRSAVGGGLRYITPIGPIGILYGVKLDPQARESSGRFHFSIGYTF